MAEDLCDADHGEFLPVTVLATRILPAALLENDDLAAALLPDDLAEHRSAGDERSTDLRLIAAEHQHVGKRDALAGVSNRDFYAPGSLLNVRAEPHWLTLGMPKEFTVWFESSPAFEAPAGQAVVSYPDSNVLASGWLLGEKYLHRRAAVVDVPAGSGHIVLFAMRPQYRAQSYLTFKMFFNALTYFE